MRAKTTQRRSEISKEFQLSGRARLNFQAIPVIFLREK
jgi:hypothetical protein